MKKWVTEDWSFTLTAVEGEAAHCRAGIEKGDTFVFSYTCPEGICPRVMAEIYTWCEVIRCGGDFTYRGMEKKHEMDLPCPCGCIRFRLHAAPINRDENGNPLPNRPKPEG
ncbi:MAG: TIGR04076 family protein [Clostridia bacterium]|nr:TIGR04076 family protein [Clostridia bacterium]